MKLHGPQSDRDRLWAGGGKGSRGDLNSQRDADQVYEAELSRLRNENKTIRDQLQRALKELRAYQVKYPSPFAASQADTDDAEAALWSAAPAMMTPLLEAYDTREEEPN